MIASSVLTSLTFKHTKTTKSGYNLILYQEGRVSNKRDFLLFIFTALHT